MREHMGLYRGKRVDNGEWVEGWYCKVAFGRWPLRDAIIPNEEAEAGNYHPYEVDPDTVGECTGLPDKNGKLIFEGDIVKSVFNQRPYLVCFGEYLYREEYGNELSACGFYNKDAFDCVTDFGSPEEWAIIIGNVADNPELLQQEE